VCRLVHSYERYECFRETCCLQVGTTYRKNFYFVVPSQGSELLGDRGAAYWKPHTNVADQSACLTANNVLNEVAIIHTSQEVLKMLSLYT
jgi:hypothetical protein